MQGVSIYHTSQATNIHRRQLNKRTYGGEFSQPHACRRSLLSFPKQRAFSGLLKLCRTGFGQCPCLRYSLLVLVSFFLFLLLLLFLFYLFLFFFKRTSNLPLLSRCTDPALPRIDALHGTPVLVYWLVCAFSLLLSSPLRRRAGFFGSVPSFSRKVSSDPSQLGREINHFGMSNRGNPCQPDTTPTGTCQEDLFRDPAVVDTFCESRPTLFLLLSMAFCFSFLFFFRFYHLVTHVCQ